jgi:hypothetical protein
MLLLAVPASTSLSVGATPSCSLGAPLACLFAYGVDLLPSLPLMSLPRAESLTAHSCLMIVYHFLAAA